MPAIGFMTGFMAMKKDKSLTLMKFFWGGLHPIFC